MDELSDTSFSRYTSSDFAGKSSSTWSNSRVVTWDLNDSILAFLASIQFRKLYCTIFLSQVELKLILKKVLHDALTTTHPPQFLKLWEVKSNSTHKKTHV